MNKLIISAALGAFVASGAVLSSAPDARAQECGAYIILGCFKTRTAAEKREAQLGLSGTDAVIYTNDFDGFRRGFYCVADGPYDPLATMLDQSRREYRKSVPDAYIKEACRRFNAS